MNRESLNCGYYVCSVIGNELNKRTDIKLNNNLENNLVSDFIDKHHLGSIIGSIAQNNEILSSQFSQYVNSVNDALFRQMKFDIMCEKISAEFSKKKIRHMVLKGSELGRFYPDYILRTSSDIDFFVDKKNIKDACDILEKAEFTPGNINEKSEYQYFKQPRYNIELHTILEGFSKKQKRTLLSLADNANKVKDYRYRLTDSDCYIQTLFHLYKHFVLSGVGVRMFLDVYVLSKNAKIDFEYADNILSELGILDFSKVVSQINDVLFGDKTADDELKEVIDFIFNSGIYGSVSTNLHLDRINRDIKDISKLKHLSDNYGLSFQKMKKRYPVLIKAPYLYPFSFIHRFFYGIIHKRDAIKNDIKVKKSISHKRIEKYERVFKIARIIK